MLLSAKRIREHLSVFASLFVVIAIVSGLGVGLLGFLGLAATHGVRADLATRPGAELAMRISQLEGADPATQDREARTIIESEFQSAGRPIAMDVDRTLASQGSLGYTRLGGTAEQDGRAIVASIPALRDRASLVDGEWPTHDGEASIQADAALGLGLVVGDRVRLGTAELTITGSWRVDDDLDPRWSGESVMITGSVGALFGPLVIDDEAWQAIGETPEVRWTLVPDAAAITASDLESLDAAWTTLGQTMDEAGVGESAFSQTGGFSTTATELSAQVRALDAVKPIALLLIAVIALVTVLELGRLLTEIREFELALLWSRGATAGELARTTAIESAIVSLLGAVLGTGLAIGILAVLEGADALADVGSALWAVPLATVVVSAIAIASQTYRSMRKSARRDAPDRSGRVRRVAGLGAVVLVTLAATVSVAQLRLYGSPITPLAGGGTAVDPVTVLAPALALISLVLIGLLGFPLVAPLVERAAERDLGADRVLAARSISRRLTLVATPIVLIALACGQFVIAGGYGGTWESAFTRTQELRAGTSVRVTTTLAGLADSELDQIVTTPGVTVVAPVYSGELQTAGDYASVIGVAPRALAELALTADGTIDPVRLAASIDLGATGAKIPTGEGELSVTITTSGFVAPPGVSVWLSDEFGQLRRIDLKFSGTPDAAPRLRYTAVVAAPPGEANAWHLSAVDVRAIGDDPAQVSPGPAPRVDVVAIERDGEELDLGGPWAAYGFGEVSGPLTSTATSHGTSVPAGTDLARLVTANANGDDPLASPVPVVISTTLADRLGAAPGTVLSLPLVGRTAPAAMIVTEIVNGIPAAPDASGLLVDIRVIEALRLRSFVEPPSSTVLWVGATDPRSLGQALRQALPGEIAVDAIELDPTREMFGSAAASLWVAAVGSALLALAALGAVAGAQIRGRRGEVVVLRAIGLGSRQQGWIRRREFALVTGYGVVVGLLAGVLASLLTIAPLARAAVPDSFPEIPTYTMFDLALLALALTGLLLLVAGTTLTYGATTAAQARTLGGQEVVR